MRRDYADVSSQPSARLCSPPAAELPFRPRWGGVNRAANRVHRKVTRSGEVLGVGSDDGGSEDTPFMAGHDLDETTGLSQGFGLWALGFGLWALAALWTRSILALISGPCWLRARVSFRPTVRLRGVGEYGGSDGSDCGGDVVAAVEVPVRAREEHFLCTLLAGPLRSAPSARAWLRAARRDCPPCRPR